MSDPQPIRIRHSRQGYREAAARLAVMQRRVAALLVALEDAPDDLTQAMAEAAAPHLEAAATALRAAAAELHR
jgi:hypothetical protein